MEKIIELEGQELGLKVSAGTVLRYRNLFGRDLIVDIGTLEQDIFNNKALSTDGAAVAEKVVWLMAKDYNPEIPPVEDWLDNFSPYFTYSAFIQVLNMWHENIVTLNNSKKN